MKIVPPFYTTIKNKILSKYTKNLDYRLFYEAYKRYVIDISSNVPNTISFDKVEKPKVSIIIPVHNQYSFTMKCLLSVKQNTTLKDYEIIIVDDCSTDQTKRIENCVSNTKIIRNEINKGFLLNCNIGVKEAKGEYIYLLNNDTYILPNAINKLVEILDCDENVGAVGSKLIYPDGKLQGAGSAVMKNGNVYSIGHLETPFDEKYNYLKEVDYCCGASLMIRKSIWDLLGGFDELFIPAYFEETDLCLQIKKLGYKVMYQPESEVIHYTSQSYNENSFKQMEINHKKFKQKWNMH